MTKYVPWTLSTLAAGLILVGSLALAQWEPKHYEIRRWFQPPAIPAKEFDPVFNQQLCYWIRGGRVAGYLVEDYYPNEEDWKSPPDKPGRWDIVVESGERR